MTSLGTLTFPELHAQQRVDGVKSGASERTGGSLTTDIDAFNN